MLFIFRTLLSVLTIVLFGTISPRDASLAGVAALAMPTTSDAAVYKTSELVPKVAVTGATGRTGSLVVKELLSRGVEVVAIVRDAEKAKEKFGSSPPNLVVKICDLGNEEDICSAVKGCDAAIWCATGFSDAPGVSVFDRIKKILGLSLAPQNSIDAVGVPALATAFSAIEREDRLMLPKVVMLSSAGVTRPGWDDEKKEMFKGCSDIPIVRLNPFGILDIKAESEEKLRLSGVKYAIFRPGGLNDKWPAGSRPVFSQGDVAVGRINRQDAARILVDILTTPEAVGKTFEAITVANYPPANDIGTALSRMKLDSEGIPSNEVIAATYSAMQQLIPGEKQDAASLAMGQTYEQLDRGEVGRLGKRGEEDAEAAAPKPSS